MQKYHVMEMGERNKKVIFLLAGWYNKLWMFWIFSKILAINGYYCITYAYDSDIFSPDTVKTTRHMKEIMNEILKKINQLKKEGYKDFSVFGTSLGSMIALMVANKSSEISRVILNTTGIDVAETVWGWDNLNSSFKKKLTQQGITLVKLKKIWKSITPANNISNLNKKKILIYLSEKDEVIPFTLGKRLIRRFDAMKYNYILVKNNKFKHLYTGAYNLFKVNVYLNFLKN